MRHTLLFVGALLLVAGVVTVRAHAQTGGGYDLTWWTVDNGGNRLTGGTYVLVGTAGQPDAGSTLTGSSYRLVGGFWPSTPYMLYLPLTMKNH